MMKHTRIYCHECKRERLNPTKYFVNSSPITITGNKRDDLCIYCGSGSIEEITYEPPFLGGDIPRPDIVPNIPIEVFNTGEDYNPNKVEKTTPGMAMNNTIGMVCLLLFLLIPTSVWGQVVIKPGDVFAWGQEDTTLANVQGGIFTLIYGLNTNVILTNVTCSGANSPYDCSARIPSLPPGNYSLQLVYSRNVNGVQTNSPPSATLLITVPVPPIPPALKAPINFRITQ